MKALILAAAACLSICDVTHAAAPLDVKLKSTTTGGLKADTLYEIDLKCERGTKPLPTSWQTFDASVKNAFAHVGATASQYLIISNTLPAVDAANPGQITMPSAAIRAFPVFSMKFDHVVDYRTACTGSTYIVGGQKIYLIPVVSWSTQVTAGPILGVIGGLAQAITPLWSIFAPLPAAVASKVSDVQPAESALGSILATLNKDENYAAATSIGVGSYVVTTDFSKITVTVTQLNALLRSKSTTIRTDFTNQLNSGAKLSSASDCAAIAGQLLESGFDKTLDIPFALTWLAGRSFGSKNDVLQCLGPDYALNAARISKAMLWNFIAPSLVITEQQALDAFPTHPQVVQPTYPSIDSILADFVLDLSRIGVSADPPPANTVAELQTNMTAKVVLNDKTVASTFGFVTGPLNAENLATAFTTKGYRKFGCNGQLTTTFGDNPAGAVGIFAAFKVPANATSANENDAILVAPLFEKGLISTIYVYDALNEIDAVLKANNYLCGANLKIAH